MKTTLKIIFISLLPNYLRLNLISFHLWFLNKVQKVFTFIKEWLIFGLFFLLQAVEFAFYISSVIRCKAYTILLHKLQQKKHILDLCIVNMLDNYSCNTDGKDCRDARITQISQPIQLFITRPGYKLCRFPLIKFLQIVIFRYIV